MTSPIIGSLTPHIGYRCGLQKESDILFVVDDDVHVDVVRLRLWTAATNCSSPRWYMSMENHGGIISTIENSWFVHQSSLAILLAELYSG
jgi:hypothetical protein